MWLVPLESKVSGHEKDKRYVSGHCRIERYGGQGRGACKRRRQSV